MSMCKKVEIDTYCLFYRKIESSANKYVDKYYLIHISEENVKSLTSSKLSIPRFIFSIWYLAFLCNPFVSS